MIVHKKLQIYLTISLQLTIVQKIATVLLDLILGKMPKRTFNQLSTCQILNGPLLPNICKGLNSKDQTMELLGLIFLLLILNKFIQGGISG